MTHTPELLAFQAAVTSGTQNVFVSACAGGGKTTAIDFVIRSIPRGPSIVALAFNKDASESLRAKLPWWVTASTWHSFCLDALGVALGRKPRVDAKKCEWILRDALGLPKTKPTKLPTPEEKRLVGKFFTLREPVLKTVSLCKSEPDSDPRDIASRYGIELDAEGIELVLRILAESLRDTARVDFDDMLWLAHKLHIKFPPVDFLFVDEAQDTNAIQRALIQQISPRRFIAVGDPHQGIYAFRGADANAVEQLIATYNMTVLPLSVSWRCSVAVVEEARKWL